MEHSAGLARLEEFVDNLLNQHAQLRGENLALQRTIHDRESEIRSLKQEIQDLRAQLESVNANRTEDGDAAFAEISKYAAKYKNLEARIVKLEKQFLA